MTGIDASADEIFYGEREVEVDDPWWFVRRHQRSAAILVAFFSRFQRYRCSQGASHLIVWGTAAVPQCCPGFPTPDPARGGPQGLAAYAKRLHAAGITMSTYFESQQGIPTPPSSLFLGRFAPVFRRFSTVPLRCPASWRRDGENGRKMAKNGRNLGEKRARNSGG